MVVFVETMVFCFGLFERSLRSEEEDIGASEGGLNTFLIAIRGWFSHFRAEMTHAQFRTQIWGNCQQIRLAELCDRSDGEKVTEVV